MRTEDILSILVAQSLVMAMRECFSGMCHLKAKQVRILEFLVLEHPVLNAVGY